MRKWISFILLAALVSIMAGCQNSNSNSNETLTLSVAASLTDCMNEIEKAFHEVYPNIDLQFNFGASGTLQKQIEQGAPVDIFFSAGMKQMNALKDAGLLDEESIKEVLNNRLALIVPKDSLKKIKFDTLTGAEVEKIAVGEPESVPAGQYTLQVFDALGITNTLQSKLVYAKDVREVLTWVETGNVDAGIVYETDAKISEKVSVCDLADESLHDAITYPVAIIKSTEHLESAKKFEDFLMTQDAKAIFEKYGFTTKF